MHAKSLRRAGFVWFALMVGAWLAFFTLMLGLTVWESSWEGWLRLLLVACFAVASAAFYPRKAGERS